MTGRLYTRIALTFLMLIGIGLLAVTLWFFLTVGRPVARDVHALLRNQNNFVASLVTTRLAEGAPAESCAPLFARLSRELDVTAALLDKTGTPLVTARGRSASLPALTDGWQAAIKEEGRFVQKGHSGKPVVYVRPLDIPGQAAVYLYTSRQLAGDRHHLAFLAGVLVIFCLLAAAVYPLSRSITRPLSRLTGSLERIAAGDFTAAPDFRRTDEIGRLFAVFREMSRSVHDMISTSRQLLADMSHELRSPLTRMRLGTELLRPSVSGDTAGRHLAGIEREIETLDRLVSRMAAYSRMNLPGFVFSPEPVDPGELAAEAKERYLPLAESRQVELKLALEPDLPEIVADAELLRQVFDNLLDNALAHTPAGGRVTIGVRHQDNRICIVMADTGPGVPDEHRERIFEPLYRVDPARNAATGGAGLGLAIARKIMDLHGGNIEYRQKENETGFYFILNKEPLNQGGK